MSSLRTNGPLQAPQHLFSSPAPAQTLPARPATQLFNAVSKSLAPGYSADTFSAQAPTQGLIRLKPLSLPGLSRPSTQTQQLISWAGHLLNTVKENKYVLGGTTVDFNRGIVKTDCSGLVRALWSKVGIPLTGLNAAAITRHIEDPRSNFKEVVQAARIQPGDVIGVKMPNAKISGHVMIAWGSPEPIVKQGQVVGYNLQILDSSSSHSADSRSQGQSGIGTGTVSVKIDPRSGELERFYWRADFAGNSWTDVAVGRHA